MAEKEPFKVAIPAPVLTDLRGRLKKTRWADDFANEQWAYGTNGAELRQLVDYWLKDFNWRRQEREINRFAHYRTTDRGHPDPFHPRAGQGTAADPADPEPRLAVDLLGPAQGNQAFERSRRLRRIARRRLRRGGPLASRLRFLHPVDHPRHQLLAHRRPVGPTDAGRARLPAVCRARRRLGRADHGATRPQVRGPDDWNPRHDGRSVCR